MSNSRKTLPIIIAVIVVLVLFVVVGTQFMAKDSSEPVASEHKPAAKVAAEQKPVETGNIASVKPEVVEKVVTAVSEGEAAKNKRRGRITFLNNELSAIIQANNLTPLDEDKLNSIKFLLDKIKEKKIVRRGNIFIDQSTVQIVAVLIPGQKGDELDKDLLAMIDIDFNRSPANAVFNFDFDVHSNVLNEQISGLEAFKALVAKNKGQIEKVVIFGNTDNIGRDKYNWGLSVKRGESFCRLADIEADTVVVVPRGESSPVADNLSEDGRAKNRRVEVLIQFKEI